jgi:GT2 family glycosyltransferase
MTVSVIIVNWNSRDYVRQCLTSLNAHCPAADREVIVVDGGSFDGCGEMLTREFPAVVFVQSPDNIGFARANNLGARHARGRYLLLLNPDTLFHEDSIRLMRERFETLPQAGAAGCRLLNADRTLQTSCVQALPTVLNQMLDSEYLRQRFRHWSLWGVAALYAQPPQPAVVEAISGACILIPREIFEAVGGFTESYFMYAEDMDLCFKVRQAGHHVYYLPETSLVHFGGGSSSKAPSNFSTVMTQDSICRFIRLNRGFLPAAVYRLGMMLTALVRLLLIGPMLLFGDRIVQHGRGSWHKWLAVLRWSLGLELARGAPATGAKVRPPRQ